MSAPLVSGVNTARKSAPMAVLVRTARSSVSAKTRPFATPRLVSAFVLLAGRARVAIDPVKKGDTAKIALCNVIVTMTEHVMLKQEIVHAELDGLVKNVTANAMRAISVKIALKRANAMQIIRSTVMQ